MRGLESYDKSQIDVTGEALLGMSTQTKSTASPIT